VQNPLESYRRTQRELRRHFDEFTRDHCPECPTPCCLRPARLTPADILLAEATGWRSPVTCRESRPSPGATTARPADGPGHESAPADAPSIVAGRIADALSSPPETAEDAHGVPCEFLGAGGCGFPADLRPFGCTTYICRYMHAALDRRALARIRRLVRELEQKHDILMRALRLSR
jgi:hypothetical protein